MTNREWLHSLSDEQFAEFLADSLFVRINTYSNCPQVFPIGVKYISRRYTQQVMGLRDWLSRPQEFTVDGINSGILDNSIFE